MTFAFLNSKAHLLLERSSEKVSGGAELQVALLARELAERDHDVHLLHAVLHGGESVRFISRVRCVPCGPFHRSGLVDVIRAIPKVFGAIRQAHPDYVLVLGWTAWLYLLWLGRRLFNFKLVFICGLDTEADGTFSRQHGVRGCLFDFAMRHSDLVIAMSEHQRALYLARDIQPGFYRNLVLERTRPRDARKDIDLLWVARCQTVKRPMAFLDLVAQMPNAGCTMVCPPEDLQLWQEVQKRAKTLPNLDLHEMVPYHQIQSVYDRAKVFVNTSVTEGYANSFIQAGQGGAAILSLSVDCDGVLERFGAGYCAGDDQSRLLRHARQMLSDPVELERLAANAERFVGAWHNNQTNVDAFLQSLEPATGKGGRS